MYGEKDFGSHISGRISVSGFCGDRCEHSMYGASWMTCLSWIHIVWRSDFAEDSKVLRKASAIIEAG